MEQISDYYRYTQLMRNGFYDKLFFIDKLFEPWKSLVDYGCADGFQTKIIAEIFPDKEIVGYDPDPDMINRARYSGSMPANIRFTSDKSDTLETDVFYASSVLHEVHSYAKDQEEIDDFWKYVFNPKRRYIAIRDMMDGSSISPPHTRTEHLNAVLKWAENRQLTGELERFQERFGSIEEKHNFIHFLLKMPYITSPNWMREVHENYLPYSYSYLMAQSPSDWAVEYEERYAIPYLKHYWRKELGIDIPYHTHFKILLRNIS